MLIVDKKRSEWSTCKLRKGTPICMAMFLDVWNEDLIFVLGPRTLLQSHLFTARSSNHLQNSARIVEVCDGYIYTCFHNQHATVNGPTQRPKKTIFIFKPFTLLHLPRNGGSFAFSLSLFLYTKWKKKKIAYIFEILKFSINIIKIDVY